MLCVFRKLKITMRVDFVKCSKNVCEFHAAGPLTVVNSILQKLMYSSSGGGRKIGSCFMGGWGIYLVFVFVFVFVFAPPREEEEKLDHVLWGLRRLSCGLIASSLSTTNWSWRPGIISSNQFSHLDDRSNIFKHNMGGNEGQACIGLKLIRSSGKKTLGRQEGETSPEIFWWWVMVRHLMAKVEMLKLLIAKVCCMSASQLFPSYSYAVANTGPALPFLSRPIVRCSPAAADICICICIAIPTLSDDTCTSAAKNCALWEEVGRSAKVVSTAILMRGPHIFVLVIPISQHCFFTP